MIVEITLKLYMLFVESLLKYSHSQILHLFLILRLIFLNIVFVL